MSKKDLADVVRVKYWYWAVRTGSGCKSARALERMFENQHFRLADGGRLSYPGKWKGYEYGKHVPAPTLIDLVATKFVWAYGLKREINHPAWFFLRKEGPIPNSFEHWLAQLEPRVQQAVLRRPNDMVSSGYARLAYSDAIGRRLVKLANLDALACLTLYWHESSRMGRNDETRKQAHRIYQLLVILGIHFDNRQIADDIIRLVSLRIFSLTDWGEKDSGRIDSALYRTHYVALDAALSETGIMAEYPTWTQQVQTMLHLLEKGFLSR